MTLADELSLHAEWLYLQTQEMYAKGLVELGDAFGARMRKVGILSAKCEGKVLVKPRISLYGTTTHAVIGGRCGGGRTIPDAIAVLQVLLDEECEGD